jgi:hypothetical protein
MRGWEIKSLAKQTYQLQLEKDSIFQNGKVAHKNKNRGNREI